MDNNLFTPAHLFLYLPVEKAAKSKFLPYICRDDRRRSRSVICKANEVTRTLQREGEMEQEWDLERKCRQNKIREFFRTLLQGKKCSLMMDACISILFEIISD
ncbi:hypothetical protein CDAR_545201 [Caerostris darwini]|uniref:Uncharacterized protein n=1 Tax=Caerostris darwini TaxID=1538125 RepID=A0AAV4TG44_9ARAC|nr:hypothetical protein CDAR_545201 [Caerostris darwini]